MVASSKRLFGGLLAVTPLTNTVVGAVVMVVVVPPVENTAEPVPEVVEIERVIETGLVDPPLKLTKTGTEPLTVTAVSGPKVTVGDTLVFPWGLAAKLLYGHGTYC